MYMGFEWDRLSLTFKIGVRESNMPCRGQRAYIYIGVPILPFCCYTNRKIEMTTIWASNKMYVGFEWDSVIRAFKIGVRESNTLCRGQRAYIYFAEPILPFCHSTIWKVSVYQKIETTGIWASNKMYVGFEWDSVVWAFKIGVRESNMLCWGQGAYIYLRGHRLPFCQSTIWKDSVPFRWWIDSLEGRNDGNVCLSDGESTLWKVEMTTIWASNKMYVGFGSDSAFWTLKIDVRGWNMINMAQWAYIYLRGDILPFCWSTKWKDRLFSGEIRPSDMWIDNLEGSEVFRFVDVQFGKVQKSRHNGEMRKKPYIFAKVYGWAS